MDTKDFSEAPSNRVYEVFEPYCKWRTEEGREILEIDLKGFKKEQLKVRTNNKLVLIISGERPLNATKWSRFQKETKLPKGCNFKEVHAKFSQGFLSIIMPKKLQLDDSTELQILKTKGAVWGMKIDKGRMLKVAAVVAVVVLVVAIARLVDVYRHPHDAAKEHFHV